MRFIFILLFTGIKNPVVIDRVPDFLKKPLSGDPVVSV
jgi:hypothetical protein